MNLPTFTPLPPWMRWALPGLALGALALVALVTWVAGAALGAAVALLLAGVAAVLVLLLNERAQLVTDLSSSRTELRGLRRTYRQLAEAVAVMPEAMALFDANDRLVIASHRYREMNQKAAGVTVAGVEFEAILRAAADAGEVLDAIGREDEWVRQRLAHHRTPRQDFIQALSHNRWVQVTERRTPEGGMVCLRTDVTELMRQRNALQTARQDAQEARRLLERALNALPTPLEVFDEQDRLILCNTALRQMFSHIDYDDALGKTFRELAARTLQAGVVPEAVGQEARWLDQRIAGRVALSSHEFLQELSGPRWVQVYERRTPEKYLVSIRLDVTDRVLKEQQLAQANRLLASLSTTDGLTNVHNRRSLDETLDREWLRCARHQQPLALLMIDIDHFKLYNDHYGHMAGDECLRRVARLLEAEVRRTGEIVARYGGEEFVLLLPGVDETGAAEVAQRCLASVQQAHLPHELSPNGGRVTLSIGAAAHRPHHERSPQVLLMAADEALYRAKTQGRNQVAVAQPARTGLRAI